MNSIGNLLAQYRMERFGRGFRIANPYNANAKSVAQRQPLNNAAVKVELGEDNQKDLLKVKPHHTNIGPLERSPKKHPVTTNPTTDMDVQKESSQNPESMAPSQTKEALDFKEIQQLKFQELKAAWGTKEGENNYNASYDLDKNGVIDMVDYLAFGKELQKTFEEFKLAWGTRSGEDSFDGRYDYDSNGVIDMKDWLVFGENWVA